MSLFPSREDQAWQEGYLSASRNESAALGRMTEAVEHAKTAATHLERDRCLRLLDDTASYMEFARTPAQCRQLLRELRDQVDRGTQLLQWPEDNSGFSG